jgi:hypothetical protein
MEMSKDSCCTNSVEHITGQDDLNFHSLSFDIVPPAYILPIAFFLVDVFPEVSPETVAYPPYQPPQLVHDIQVLCQVFLI